MPFADFGDHRTHYQIEASDRPVLVLSNSLGTNLSMWEPQRPHLAQHFRVLRYDTRGHGQSSVTLGDYTIEQLGRDVLQLLDSLKIKRVHFCGLSMGGAIGIWLGIHAPDRLKRLVLCNTAARIGTPDMWNARIATVRRDGMKPVAATVIERWFTPGFRASHPQQVAQTQRMLETTPPEGYAACCAAIRDVDLRDGVAQIKTPTLVVYGEKDPVTPLADVDFLKNTIPGAVAVGLSAAHLSNVEQADAFTKAVSEFLSS
ncbi:MAG TPA: 3-oxoadipate enol-lactonase [Terriglobales bacterium]|jgi:3-oxoadipate enol-lactonase|nr:3-oxoadipate enol-lactonase [Terriglobales bacterium]